MADYKEISAYYQATKHTLKNGDGFLTQGRSLLSHTIRGVDNSRWSHVALVVMVNGRRCILEMLGDGLVLNPISHRLHDFSDYAVMRFNTEQRIIDMAVEGVFGKWEIGVKYADMKLIRFLLLRAFGKDFKKLNNPKDWVCSDVWKFMDMVLGTQSYEKYPLISPGDCEKHANNNVSITYMP